MMKFKCLLFCVATCLLGGLWTSCAEDEKFTGLVFSGGNKYIEPNSTTQIVATYYNDDKADNSVMIQYEIVSAKNDSDATLSKNEELSGKEVELTIGEKEKLVLISAKYNGYTVYTTVGIKNNTNVLSKNDVPMGFALAGFDMSKIGATNDKIVEVSTPDDLILYAGKGGYLIKVKGTIDMSRGMLPAEGKKMDGPNATSELNSFIENFYKSSDVKYKTYSEWINAKTNVSASEGNYPDKALSNAYKAKVQIRVRENTAIIGEKGAIIRGATFSVESNNILIRNLTIKDAVDPFPEHQKNDGWNAQHDNICVSNGEYIWIDHCTLEDTLTLGTAKNGEKWQVYDGLLDMKEPSTKISVTNTILRNHDKTMLIGTSDTKGDANLRFITLAFNEFNSCGQRCPMVRNTRIHIFGNKYNGSPTVNARAGSLVFVENNRGGSTPSNNSGTFVGFDGVFDVAPVYPYVTQSDSPCGANQDIDY